MKNLNFRRIEYFQTKSIHIRFTSKAFSCFSDVRYAVFSNDDHTRCRELPRSRDMMTAFMAMTRNFVTMKTVVTGGKKRFAIYKEISGHLHLQTTQM